MSIDADDDVSILLMSSQMFVMFPLLSIVASELLKFVSMLMPLMFFMI